MRHLPLARLLLALAIALVVPASASARSAARRQAKGHTHVAARHGKRSAHKRNRRYAKRASVFNSRHHLRFPSEPGTPSSGQAGDGSSTLGAQSEVPAGGQEGAGATGAGTVEAPALAIPGSTYYVSPAGSDANSGTSPSSPWRTVKRVNEAALQPGDGVLFQGGASFADETLMPSASGAPGSPIVFGTYGAGNASLPLGMWFKGEHNLAFSHLSVGADGNIQGTGNEVTVEWCDVEGSPGVGINAMGSNWTIDDNTVNDIGISGMLLEGEDDTISANTITNTGLDKSIPYGMHGIYLKVSNATATHNAIENFSADGISARYRNSTIAENYIAGGPIGIAWFQYDPVAGTSHWTDNTIADVSEAGIYVSPSDQGGATRESFVIEHNSIEPASGATFLNLQPTTGSYVVQENDLH
jgi:hypothetical protein